MSRRRRVHGGAIAALAAAAMGLGAPAWALDPTQPPPAWRAAAPAASAASAAPQDRPRLQGVRLGAEPSALISGRVLRPGQTWQGHTLLRIEVDGAVLRDPEGRSLRLHLLTPPPPAMLPASGVRP